MRQFGEKRNDWEDSESNDVFNEDVRKKSLELLRAKQAFEKRIALSEIGKKELNELSNIRHEARVQFIEGAKSTLISASKKHFLQYLDLENTPKGEIFKFDQYLRYSNPDEDKTVEEFSNEETVSFRLVEKIDEDGEASGDEMYIHFFLPNKFIFASNIGDTDIDNWLAEIFDVKVVYRHDPSKGRVPDTYHISGGAVKRGQMIIEDSGWLISDLFPAGTSEEQIAKDQTEADFMIELFKRLGTMKLFKFRTKNIRVV